MADLFFCHSRYGQILAEEKLNDMAVDWLLKSVSIYPWNWSAWLELSLLVRNVQQVCCIPFWCAPPADVYESCFKFRVG